MNFGQWQVNKQTPFLLPFLYSSSINTLKHPQTKRHKNGWHESAVNLIATDVKLIE
jgi:hypothetical protein